MKKNKIIKISILISLCLLVLLSLLFFYKNNFSRKENNIVFIENIKDGDIKEGMGFVYKSQEDYNLIVTNYHVIESSNQLYVYDFNDKNKMLAEVVNYDLFTDIAILKINDNLKINKVRISENQPKKSDEVLYYNLEKNCFDKGQIISLNNEIILNGSYYKVGIIDSKITPGNSGGPLFNSNNEVVGMIALKDTKTNNGFFIPIDYVIQVVKKLEKNELHRPKLGATFTNTSNLELITQYGFTNSNVEGIIILELKENSILKVNGFKLGDVITKINDKLIENVVLFQKELYSLKQNEIIKLEFYRNNELMETSIKLK